MREIDGRAKSDMAKIQNATYGVQVKVYMCYLFVGGAVRRQAERIVMWSLVPPAMHL